MHTVENRISYSTFVSERSDQIECLYNSVTTQPDFDLTVDSAHDLSIFNEVSRFINAAAIPFANYSEYIYVNQEQSNPILHTEQFGFFSNDRDATKRADTGQVILNICLDNIKHRPQLYRGKRKVVSTFTHDIPADVFDYQLSSLQDGEYLGDEIINHIFENVFAQMFDDSLFFRTDFYTLLNNVDIKDAVDPDTLGGKDSIFHLKKIFIPLHRTDDHWILQHVDMERKVVELRDSLGHHNPLNERYMPSIIDFLWRAHIYVGGAPMQFEHFAEMWCGLDMSTTCAGQRNGHDCAANPKL
eukprot:scaffold9474_cov148-Skeletonema_dohrnii-CCMP3373.AAC.4